MNHDISYYSIQYLLVNSHESLSASNYAMFQSRGRRGPSGLAKYGLIKDYSQANIQLAYALQLVVTTAF